MTARALSAASARRRFVLLTVTRWFPVGLVIGVTTLIALERGMSLTQLGVILAMQGFVVLGLELPTGGLSDAVGRRPVLLGAGVVALASGLVFITAHTFAAFMLALALQGVFRALDSGPLEAWYVDTAQADDPAVRVEDALTRAGTALGVSIASGALISGALVAWHPIAAVSALELPYWIALGFYAVNLVAIAVLMREDRSGAGSRGLRRALRSAREAPRTVAAGVRTLGSSRVLRALVMVEVFWSVGMIAFETLMPVRLSELVGGQTQAGALMGPVSAAAWGLFAAGSALAGLASRRLGVGWTALLARALNGALIVVMGLATGPVGLVTAFLITYTLHGSGGPVHSALLHREADASNRTTVLSMNSMVAGGSYTLGLLVLSPLAEHASTAAAIVVAGAFSVLGAVLYLPAIRQERSAARAGDGAGAGEPRAARGAGGR
ncbi:MFS transporter [Pengzhenrongella sicca]|uniref:MFS transporter n=1 Tax=Pengzhenrongella sicca TaxID=2819238 RepID=A0A8A4ZB55_9MICO|nr:MFS transporter [Pengzhenrongella sicca]QTE28249.1 MFS transporter [Pengzhenrongella sicca]